MLHMRKNLVMRSTACLGLTSLLCLLTSLAGYADVESVQATNPYTPEEVCGPGFFQLDHQDIGVETATVYVLYNNSTGENCVVTLKLEHIGEPTLTDARLWPESDENWTIDRGNFNYYAGPVKRPARAVCIRWGGGALYTNTSHPYEMRFESQSGFCSALAKTQTRP